MVESGEKRWGKIKGTAAFQVKEEINVTAKQGVQEAKKEAEEVITRKYHRGTSVNERERRRKKKKHSGRQRQEERASLQGNI